MGRLSDKGPPTEAELARQLKIKVGVVKRLSKEATSYEKEAKTQEAKIAAMRDAGKDIYDIKKQEEVLQESYMMIPDSKARLQAALEDLKAFLAESGEVKEVQGSEFFTEASALLAQVADGGS